MLTVLASRSNSAKQDNITEETDLHHNMTQSKMDKEAVQLTQCSHRCCRHSQQCQHC